MRIAYIISAYKLPAQLVRLVKRLDAEEVSFFIHVDRKTGDDIFDKMRKPLAGLPNVFFLDRHACHYCDFGHVRATLKGIRAILRSGTAFDYAILLTGQDYPLKSNRRILETLENSGGKSFITHFPLPCDVWGGNGGLDRFAYWHVQWRGRRYALPRDNPFKARVIRSVWKRLSKKYPLKRKFPDYVSPFGGDSYWCLSRACILYVHEFLIAHPDFVRFFKTVNIPDEIFFQTILLNSPLKGGLVNNDMRYVDWSRPSPPYPAVLTKDDFNRLVRSDDLFGRKFDTTVDPEVLDSLDEEFASE